MKNILTKGNVCRCVSVFSYSIYRLQSTAAKKQNMCKTK